MTSGNLTTKSPQVKRLPSWLRRDIPPAGKIKRVKGILADLNLQTVCVSARCPNLPECFSKGTATFMIMGDTCTRACKFCAIKKGKPAPLRADEPQAVAQAAQRLGLSHVVITSVTRDDLPLGGAEHFAKTIRAVQNQLPHATIEVLTPDFQGNLDAIKTVIQAKPDVFNHNVETVPRLYPSVRPGANYARSLAVLSYTKNFAEKTGERIIIKSGLMLGLGEKRKEVLSVMRDLRSAGCDVLTIGQYLAPSLNHHPIVNFVEPSQFDEYRDEGLKMGFLAVASGPFVRSSYNAAEVLHQVAGGDKSINDTSLPD